MKKAATFGIVSVLTLFLSGFFAVGCELATSSAHQWVVIVDYDKSIDEMIADGNYDWKNGYITDEHFSVSGSGQVAIDLELVPFGMDKSTAAVLVELDERNLRPATLHELLAFGAQYPEEQYCISALGSVWMDWYGNRLVAYLHEYDGQRELSLFGLGHDWFTSCRFLAANK